MTVDFQTFQIKRIKSSQSQTAVKIGAYSTSSDWPFLITKTETIIFSYQEQLGYMSFKMTCKCSLTFYVLSLLDLMQISNEF